jgi:hypothetical protein
MLIRLIPSLTMLAGGFILAGPPPPDPQPGTLNSLTGEVWINQTPVSPNSTGRVTLTQGSLIKTGDGMAELLLNPGSFLRVGKHSELTLDLARAPQIRVRLRHGEALLEVLDVQDAPVVLEQNGVTVPVRKPGLYELKGKHPVIAVYDHEARVPSDNRSTLLSWSRTRSEQLSSESAASALVLAATAAHRHSPKWYWDAWSVSYTYLTASGVISGPFGWPYYAPGYAPNYAPVHAGGDSWLYGRPVLVSPGPASTLPANSPPAVPLTAPGEPRFPNSQF